MSEGTQHQPRNLVDGIIDECNRVRELVVEYDRIGPAGAFGAVMLRLSITNAERALGSGDVVAMLGAYQDLKNCE